MMARAREDRVVLLLQFDTPHQDLLPSILHALQHTSGCSVNQLSPGSCLEVSVQLPQSQQQQQQAALRSSAEAVLWGVAWLEQNAQATEELLRDLERAGHNAGNAPQSAQQLIPLVQRCGILTAIFPQHDPTAVQQLRSKVWTTLLAPVTDFRLYYGDQVGFYLAYLNALSCWLLAPAAVGSYLMWALGTDRQTAGLSSPLVPIVVVFQLLWSAVGVKLWSRHQALLRRQWHTTVSTSTPPWPNQPGWPGSPPQQVQADANAGSAGRAPSMPVDHFGGGVPQWAVRAPNTTGVRWQFAGVWRRNRRGHFQLQEGLLRQLLRVAASAAATGLLLLVAGAVLLACLNLQGLIAPNHSVLFMPALAALGHPGGLLGQGLLAQVPMIVRVLAVALFDACFFGPAATALTGFENRRTLEGFDASLTAKKAALQLLFTFAPAVYVGLAGAGAAAAANDAAAYFRLELVRRVVMELAMPWITLWVNTKRRTAQLQQGQRQHSAAPPTSPKRSSESALLLQQQTGTPSAQPLPQAQARYTSVSADQAPHSPNQQLSSTEASQPLPATLRQRVQRTPLADASGISPMPEPASTAGGRPAIDEPAAGVIDDVFKPVFEPFTGIWDVTRDMGYVMLFASILPWAAPLTLLYTLAKIKQDCMALLLVYQRPMPRRMRNLGSWNTVLLVQVLLSVISNVFLSGLSSGQLAHLLPPWLVPPIVTNSLTAAAATRSADSTAASKLAHPGPFTTLQLINSNAVGAGGSSSALGGRSTRLAQAQALCPVPQLYGTMRSRAVGVCPAGHHLLQPPVLHGVMEPAGAGLELAGGTAGTSHLLLLFAIEHLLMLVLVLIMILVPNEPAAAASTQQPPPQLTAVSAAAGASSAAQGQAALQRTSAMSSSLLQSGVRVAEPGSTASEEPQ